jgi:hypothetical protein
LQSPGNDVDAADDTPDGGDCSWHHSLQGRDKQFVRTNTTTGFTICLRFLYVSYMTLQA